MSFDKDLFNKLMKSGIVGKQTKITNEKVNVSIALHGVDILAEKKASYEEIKALEKEIAQKKKSIEGLKGPASKEFVAKLKTSVEELEKELKTLEEKRTVIIQGKKLDMEELKKKLAPEFTPKEVEKMYGPEVVEESKLTKDDTVLNYNGKTFYATGKVGKTIKGDKASKEYATEDDVLRVWKDEDGNITEGKLPKDQDMSKEETMKDLVEGVEVDTKRYEFAQGKKPSGTGAWAFYIDGKEPTFIKGTLRYGDAKKEAVKIAKEKGITRIQVAESRVNEGGSYLTFAHNVVPEYYRAGTITRDKIEKLIRSKEHYLNLLSNEDFMEALFDELKDMGYKIKEAEVNESVSGTLRTLLPKLPTRVINILTDWYTAEGTSSSEIRGMSPAELKQDILDLLDAADNTEDTLAVQRAFNMAPKPNLFHIGDRVQFLQGAKDATGKQITAGAQGEIDLYDSPTTLYVVNYGEGKGERFHVKLGVVKSIIQRINSKKNKSVDESISEAEVNDTMKVIARGISDEVRAKKIADENKGSVVADVDEFNKPIQGKFRVVANESKAQSKMFRSKAQAEKFVDHLNNQDVKGKKEIKGDDDNGWYVYTDYNEAKLLEEKSPLTADIQALSATISNLKNYFASDDLTQASVYANLAQRQSGIIATNLTAMKQAKEVTTNAMNPTDPMSEAPDQVEESIVEKVMLVTELKKKESLTEAEQTLVNECEKLTLTEKQRDNIAKAIGVKKAILASKSQKKTALISGDKESANEIQDGIDELEKQVKDLDKK